MTPPRPRTPIPVDRQTQEQIAGTAVLLLERFCQGQHRGRDLNIEFRGDAHHLPETILTLRTQRDKGQTFYEIESWLTQADLQRFALIREELQKDLGNKQMPLRRTNGVTLN